MSHESDSFLNKDRNHMMGRATDTHQIWDFVILGGGATGLGIAVDASSRGFSVLLLERADFGKGTSSRSTKLIHGGVRYLRQGNIGLVRDSLSERAALRRNVPHLVEPLGFLIPCFTWWDSVQYYIGLKLYDLLASRSDFPKSDWMSSRRCSKTIPSLRSSRLRGGVLYSDGQFDDARLLISLLQTARRQGAVPLNYARAVDMSDRTLESERRVQFVDEETGHMHTARGQVIVNACGPFCDAIRRMDEPNVRPLVAASQGIHLVLPKKFLEGNAAIMIPKTSDGRVMFVIPWHEHVLLGTTDTPVAEASMDPTPLPDEIDFLLNTAAEYLTLRPTRNDVLSVFSGIRPLVLAKENKKTSALSRDHLIEVSPSRLITITGGKWTTYRGMAEDCVDRAIQVFNLAKKPSKTFQLRLHGTWDTPPIAQVNHLDWAKRVYGSDILAIDHLAMDCPAMNDRLHPDLPYRVAEVVWAVRCEMARTVEDVLARRTRALFLNAQAAIQMSRPVAMTMAQELDRDESWVEEQVEQFRHTAQGFQITSEHE